MELEDVDERIEWEARRVGSAFGVKEWEKTGRVPYNPSFSGHYYTGLLAQSGIVLSCLLNDATEQMVQFDLGRSYSGIVDVRVGFHSGRWKLSGKGSQGLRELMTRGLYRLGFEDEGVLSQFPPLTTHEKLELRLSMPREFWPKKWLDAER